jgi:hypothetical protein
VLGSSSWVLAECGKVRALLLQVPVPLRQLKVSSIGWALAAFINQTSDFIATDVTLID